MIIITIDSNIREVRDWFRRSAKRVVKRSENFLKKEQANIQRHAREIVRATVYDVYEPVVYVRTNKLYESITAHFPNAGNPRELWVESDITVAPAKAAEGGYAKFVAGEGPGIGFLRTEYGAGESRRPSYFPRKFHEGMVQLSSSIYGNLAADLQRKYVEDVLGASFK
jgi:hypothetical protein